MKNQPLQEKNSLKLIVLHLFPGVLIVIAQLFLIDRQLFSAFPPIYTFAAASIIGILGWELVFLCYQAKKETGCYNPLKLMNFQSSLTGSKLVGYTIVLFIFLGLCFSLFRPLADFLYSEVFGFMPKEFWIAPLTTASKPMIFLTICLYLFVFALLYPIIEEFYFRGYLLKRMGWMGNWGVLLNTVLFACYHFWSPWLIVTRVVALFPLYYVVSKKKSLKLGIIVHCLVNVTDVLPLILLLV